VSFESWHDFYDSAWQQPWALLVAPFAFLVWRGIAAPPGVGTRPEAKRSVVAWSYFFALESMLDPIATGPIAQAIGTPAASTVLGLTFVLLGDFRIWWLVFRLDGRARALPRALAATVGVPIAAWLASSALRLLLGALPDQALYGIHESLFVGLAFVIARRMPGRLERALLAFAGVYYALWAGADVLILSGVDAGWLLRCVPNQLYYGLTVPFVWWRFFAPSYATPPSSTQASR